MACGKHARACGAAACRSSCVWPSYQAPGQNSCKQRLKPRSRAGITTRGGGVERLAEQDASMALGKRRGAPHSARRIAVKHSIRGCRRLSPAGIAGFRSKTLAASAGRRSIGAAGAHDRRQRRIHPDTPPPIQRRSAPDVTKRIGCALLSRSRGCFDRTLHRQSGIRQDQRHRTQFF